MCQKAAEQAGNLLSSLEPDIQEILEVTGQANTPPGLAAIAAYNAAVVALQNWQSGTASEDVVEVLNGLQASLNAVFAAVPAISAPVQVLVNLLLGAVTTVITLVSANSPAPAPAPADTMPDSPAVVAHAETFNAHAVAAAGEAKVTAMTGYKPSVWEKARAAAGDTHVAQNAYKKEWAKAWKSGGFDKAPATA